MNTEDIQHRIETAYCASGNTMGWRFLYSPPHVLKHASVAFIGLNPGGKRNDPNHSQFCMESGSAYQSESWADAKPGQGKLQVQVLSLFRNLHVDPKDVLAGNLVPFRSPDWKSLKNRSDALRFGSDLWRDTLTITAPDLVVCMGTLASRELVSILNVTDLRRVKVGWGAVSGSYGRFDSGRFVQLPHLSRFSIINRPESAQALRELFGPSWQIAAE